MIIVPVPRFGLHNDLLGPGEKKNNHTVQEHRQIIWVGDVLLGQALPDAQGVVSLCIVAKKQTRFVLPLLSSLLE